MDVYKKRIPLRFVQDVVTRWWSTYSMLDRLIYLKPAIEGLKADNQIPKNLIFDEIEWKILEQVISVLKPFKMAQKHLEGEKYVTISYVPLMIDFIENKLQSVMVNSTTNDNVKSLVQTMIIDFQNRWGNNHVRKFNPNVVRGFYRRQVGCHPLIIMTSALDPRLKNLSFICNEDEKEDVWKYVLEEMKKELEKTIDSSQFSLTNDTSDNNRDNVRCEMDSDTEDFFDCLKNSQKIHDHSDNNNDQLDNDRITQLCIQELNGYKRCSLLQIYSIVDGKKTINCPLKKFWYTNKERYPILYSMALKYMCVPATSAPSERVFSVASKILTKFRNRLDPDTAGSILFIHGSLTWYKKQLKNKSE